MAAGGCIGGISQAGLVAERRNSGGDMSKCPAILSIIGWHADESPEDIVKRKRADIKKIGRTIWLYHSQKASIPTVQQFGRQSADVAVIFLRGSAFPTGASDEAQQMSDDRSRWSPLPWGIDKVTGRLPAGGLVIRDLTPVDYEIDLWEYLEHPGLLPIRFRQGASTACVVPTKDNPVEGMKSRHRRVMAVGRLVTPFGVFLR
jgi:hypothetical protein